MPEQETKWREEIDVSIQGGYLILASNVGLTALTNSSFGLLSHGVVKHQFSQFRWRRNDLNFFVQFSELF